jgi:chaperonin cofactor prefoldin
LPLSDNSGVDKNAYIKHLETENTQLKQRIETLERRIEQMEKHIENLERRLLKTSQNN